MDYREFNVEITPAEAGSHQARISSQYDVAYQPITLPYSAQEIEELMLELDKCVPGSQEIKKDPPTTAPSMSFDRLQKMGRRLFDCLLSSKAAFTFYKCMGNIEGKENRGTPVGLRLRIAFAGFEDSATAKHLLTLPWEILLDPLTEGFFSLCIFTPVIRYLTAPRLISPLEVERRLRVLLVISDPKGVSNLDLYEEVSPVREELEKLAGVDVQVLTNPDVRALRSHCLKQRTNILHYIGHGKFDPKTGEGLLAFCGRQRALLPVTGKALAEQLLDSNRDLRLVFLNTCYGATLARRQGQDAYSGVAAALTRAGMSAVLAMQFPISQPAAITFSTAFYNKLVEGYPVDGAVVEGRLALRNHNQSSLEWITPVLFLRSRNSQILKPTTNGHAVPSKEQAMPKEDAAVTQKPIRLSVRSFEGWGVEQDKQADAFLDVRRHFDDRYIREAGLWKSAVYPELHDFLKAEVRGDRPVHLSFAAHATIAFAAGYCLEAKSGLDLTILQRTQKGAFDWRKGAGPSSDEPFWKDEENLPRSVDASDVAVAVSLSRQVFQDVEFYLDQAGLAVSRILPATLDPAPAQTGVRDWDHSLQLAQQLEARIRSRSVQERLGTVHIFASAPNVFMFHLGQLARGFGAIQLYEYDFDTNKPGSYLSSLRLP